MRLCDDLAVITTTDFFTPIVDDARDFGRIAAANALSDVYAMGGEPVVAIAILGWPVAHLPVELAREVMAGAAEVCAQAGIHIAGGHSIDDSEPTFGLAVTGTVHPDHIVRNSTGRAGDLLVLTKPLGIGALAQGIKKGLVGPDQARRVIEVMATLNRSAADAARRVGVSAGTDVTGFSLLGHASEMAEGAGLAVELWRDRLPVMEGAEDLIARGVYPGATRRNLEHFGPNTTWDPALTDVDRKLLADPQTSGGLLLAVAPDRLDALVDALDGNQARAVVGRLVEGSGAQVGFYSE